MFTYFYFHLLKILLVFYLYFKAYFLGLSIFGIISPAGLTCLLPGCLSDSKLTFFYCFYFHFPYDFFKYISCERTGEKYLNISCIKEFPAENFSLSCRKGKIWLFDTLTIQQYCIALKLN